MPCMLALMRLRLLLALLELCIAIRRRWQATAASSRVWLARLLLHHHAPAAARCWICGAAAAAALAWGVPAGCLLHDVLLQLGAVIEVITHSGMNRAAEAGVGCARRVAR